MIQSLKLSLISLKRLVHSQLAFVRRVRFLLMLVRKEEGDKRAA